VLKILISTHIFARVYGHSPIHATSTYAISGLRNLIKVLKIGITFLQVRKTCPWAYKSATRPKVAGEYCWAITQEAACSCCWTPLYLHI